MAVFTEEDRKKEYKSTYTSPDHLFLDHQEG